MSGSKNQVVFPMSREKFTRTLGWQLSSNERAELTNYPRIYFCNLNKNRKKGYRERFNVNYRTYNGLYYHALGEHLQFRYELEAVMYQNEHSIYFYGRDHKEGRNVIIKNITARDGLPWGGIEREFCYLKKFTRNSLKDVAVDPITNFYYRNSYFVIMEKMKLNLTRLVNVNRCCLPNFTNRIAYALFRSLKNVHDQSLIHCNLSPNKIFVTDIRTPTFKIGGFGLCCNFMEATGHRLDKLEFNAYQAPEIPLVGDISVATDVWSIGCIMFEICTGISPFDGDDLNDMVALMVERLGMPPASFLQNCIEQKVLRFFDEEGNPRYCIREDPQNNSSMLIPTPSPSGRRRALPGSSPLINALGNGDSYVLDLVTKCLTWCPEERITVENALKHPYVMRITPSY